MPNFWKAVNDTIAYSDVLLLLLDARMIERTRHPEVETKVSRSGKPLIYVITKCDLVSQDACEVAKKTLKPCVFVSSKEFHGTKLLRERILIEAKKAYGDTFKQFRVGVLGYPNVGKSSLINAMKGSRAASTSAHSGHTRGVQYVRGDNKIMFLDTPGVIPYKERDDHKHAMIGTIDYTKAKDPDLAVLAIMEHFPGRIEAHFDTEQTGEEAIEEIARQKHLLISGGEPDVARCSRMILKMWQEGIIQHA